MDSKTDMDPKTDMEPDTEDPRRVLLPPKGFGRLSSVLVVSLMTPPQITYFGICSTAPNRQNRSIVKPSAHCMV
jgi:hypothetical protein